MPLECFPMSTPSSPSSFNIVGIDPGSTTMGVASLELDMLDLRILSIETFLIQADAPTGGVRLPEGLLEYYPPRSIRMREITRRLNDAFDHYRPVQIACEAPFYNPRNPNAYGVLVEVVKTVEDAVRAWNPWRPLYRIEATSAKKAVNPLNPTDAARIKTIKDSKVRIKEAVRIFPELSFVDLDKLSEHEIDAIVVGYCQLTRLRARDFSITY